MIEVSYRVLCAYCGVPGSYYDTYPDETSAREMAAEAGWQTELTHEADFCPYCAEKI